MVSDGSGGRVDSSGEFNSALIVADVDPMKLMVELMVFWVIWWLR